MKTAFAYWDNRIAPVFDIARQIHVVETESGRIVAETEEVMANELPVKKVFRIVELGVSTLVCGAISRPLHIMVIASGIRVISFVAGDLRKVIKAWLDGDLESGKFAMPGCCRRYATSPEMSGINKEVHLMNGRKRGGQGQGGGQGQRKSGQGRGRLGGPIAGGAGGACVCPKCGNHEPHERGVPCMQKQCPKCGTAMTRE
ncbi:MAG: NifB/NifX family molybdenum-iron cluster-binding protein [Candidatus Desulfaltia sp.]|nr:NifB/NifX family molybdenum-iron cluster-binding protein [Candidatus Desulfaltia sp.]